METGEKKVDDSAVAWSYSSRPKAFNPHRPPSCRQTVGSTEMDLQLDGFSRRSRVIPQPLHFRLDLRQGRDGQSSKLEAVARIVRGIIAPAHRTRSNPSPTLDP